MQEVANGIGFGQVGPEIEPRFSKRFFKTF